MLGCVFVCVRVHARAYVYALRIVSTEEILHFINSLITVMMMMVMSIQ